jgi:hypothetical protein
MGYAWARLIGDSSKFTDLELWVSGPSEPGPSATGVIVTRDTGNTGTNSALLLRRTVKESPEERIDFVGDVSDMHFPSFGTYVFSIRADEAEIAIYTVLVSA